MPEPRVKVGVVCNTQQTWVEWCFKNCRYCIHSEPGYRCTQDYEYYWIRGTGDLQKWGNIKIDFWVNGPDWEQVPEQATDNLRCYYWSPEAPDNVNWYYEVAEPDAQCADKVQSMADFLKKVPDELLAEWNKKYQNVISEQLDLDLKS